MYASDAVLLLHGLRRAPDSLGLLQSRDDGLLPKLSLNGRHGRQYIAAFVADLGAR